jgi:hypothetical protein
MDARETVTTYDKVVALSCWFFPIGSILFLLIRDTPLIVRRHAKWSLLLPVVLVFTLTPAMALIEALSDIVFVTTPVEVAIGVYGFLLFLNLLALYRGRGPWNRPLAA